MAYGHNPAKVPKFQNRAWWYSIDRKFHADNKKSYILLLQLPTTKKCAPYFRGNMEFPIYFQIALLGLTGIALLPCGEMCTLCSLIKCGELLVSHTTQFFGSLLNIDWLKLLNDFPGILFRDESFTANHLRWFFRCTICKVNFKLQSYSCRSLQMSKEHKNHIMEILCKSLSN
jgi:hypothetical protein